MSTWDEDLAFSIGMNKYVDETYRKIYPIESITRLTRNDDPDILDVQFHIDTILTLTNGTIITAQEKIRRLYYMKYQEFTLEYMNNKFEPGEHYKLCTDIYFYAYGDLEMGLEQIYIFKTIDFKNALAHNRIQGNLQQNVYHSQASFYAYPFNQFSDDWFVYKKPYSRQPAAVS